MTELKPPATSFRQLKQEGEIKTKDIFQVPYRLLRKEAGFNPRDLQKPETIEKIQSIKQTILDGGDIPPIKVRISAGLAYISDGECRFTAYGLAIAEGAEIDFIDCLPEKGNDAERLMTAMTSSQSEPLTPLETALAYRRLIALNWTKEGIAKRRGKSVPHVEQLLLLANANVNVHNAIKYGMVNAAIAIEAVRKYGENAGAWIQEQHDKAIKAGNKKVTAKSIDDKALPKKVLSSMTSAFARFSENIDIHLRGTLISMPQENASMGYTQVSIKTSDLKEIIQVLDQIQQERDKQSVKQRQQQEAAAQLQIPTE